MWNIFFERDTHHDDDNDDDDDGDDGGSIATKLFPPVVDIILL